MDDNFKTPEEWRAEKEAAVSRITKDRDYWRNGYNSITEHKVEEVRSLDGRLSAIWSNTKGLRGLLLVCALLSIGNFIMLCVLISATP